MKINLRREKKGEKELWVSICKRQTAKEKGIPEVTENVLTKEWKFTFRQWLPCDTQKRAQVRIWQSAGPWWPSAEAYWRLYSSFRELSIK